MAQLLSAKLSTTFFPSRLGDLVSKASESPLSVEVESSEGELLKFSFGKDTVNSITNVESSYRQNNVNSIFIPAKEILSIRDVIIESRSAKFNSLGFDDTYLDLANALTPHNKGANVKAFSDARKRLAEAIHGRLEYDIARSEWYFKDENKRRYNIHLTSEAVKKMSVLDTLLANHYLTTKSIVFIDEVESALHPSLIASFLELVARLAEAGIQFFISTHSYAVIKKLYIIAKRDGVSIPCISFVDDNVRIGDMREEMI